MKNYRLSKKELTNKAQVSEDDWLILEYQIDWLIRLKIFKIYYFINYVNEWFFF